MYQNIGTKIKALAAFIFFLGIIASVIIGKSVYNSWFVALCGTVGAWFGTFVLYGFGELIERVTSIDEELKNISKHMGASVEIIDPTEPAIKEKNGMKL